MKVEVLGEIGLSDPRIIGTLPSLQAFTAIFSRLGLGLVTSFIRSPLTSVVQNRGDPLRDRDRKG